MIQENCRIVEHKQIAPSYFKITFLSPYISTHALPGQFVEIRISQSTTPLLRKPFSIHKIDPAKQSIEILYEIRGQGTQLLSKYQIGQNLDVLGPLGHGYELNGLGKIAILVAGGMGIAPLKALAEKLKTPARYLLLGAKSRDQISCVQEFKDLGYQVQLATEDGSEGKKGMITEVLLEFITSLPGSELGEVTIFSCGPKTMLKAVAEIVQQKKLACQLSMEAYMACGVGACKGCALKTKDGYKMVCKDGPVIKAEDIVW